jgi:hypothetical protein
MGLIQVSMSRLGQHLSMALAVVFSAVELPLVILNR